MEKGKYIQAKIYFTEEVLFPGTRTGEGTEYDENGNIVYSGNFENGIYNGSGSLYIKRYIILHRRFCNGKQNRSG